MVDELEDTTPAQRAILASLAQDNPNHLYALEGDGSAQPARGSVAGRGALRARASSTPLPPRHPRDAWALALHPDADVVALEEQFREPAAALLALRQRARAGAGGGARGRAPARDRHGPGGDLRADRRPGRRRAGRSRRRWRSAASPSTSPGPAALFQRPEVRDAIAWLRVLADPDDSAAAARALTRPPIELRSADLARLTTIARRRKLDMVSACEAALESPQIPPEARERIQSFLKLYGAASAAMEERRADVFVRRLIEAVGLRRQRLFAAQPEVAERLLGLSRLAELAAAWARREPHGSTRDFVRYLSAVAEAGVEPAGARSRRRRARSRAWRVEAAKGIGVRPRLRARAGARRRARSGSGGRPATGLVLSRVERDDDAASAPLALLRAGAGGGRGRGGGARGGAVRPGRGPARDLPQAARGGAGGLLEGGRASSPSRGSTPRSTSTGRSPATSSC